MTVKLWLRPTQTTMTMLASMLSGLGGLQFPFDIDSITVYYSDPTASFFS
jgi:hypothetical protein